MNSIDKREADPLNRSGSEDDDDETSEEPTVEWYQVAGGKNDHLEDFDSQMPDYSSMQAEAATVHQNRARAGTSSSNPSMGFFEDLNQERSITSRDIDDMAMDRTLSGSKDGEKTYQEGQETQLTPQPSPLESQQKEEQEEVFQDEETPEIKKKLSKPRRQPPPVSVIHPTHYSSGQHPGDMSVISELEGPTVYLNTSVSKVTFMEPIDEENGASKETSASSSSQHQQLATTDETREETPPPPVKRKKKTPKNKEWNHHVRKVAVMVGCLGCLMILAAVVLLLLYIFDWIDFGIDSSSSDTTTTTEVSETDPPFSSLVLFPPKVPRSATP